MEQNNQHKPDVLVRLPYYVPDHYLAAIQTNNGFALDVSFPAKNTVYNQVQDPSFFVNAIIYIQSHYVELIVTTTVGTAAGTLSKWLGKAIRTIFSWPGGPVSSKGAIETQRRIEIIIPWKDKAISAIFQGDYSEALIEKMTDKLIAYMEKNQLAETENPGLPEPTDMPMKLNKPRVRIRYNPETDSYEIVKN